MSYYSLQLLLYRSFIHYVTPISVKTRHGAHSEFLKAAKRGLTPHTQKYYNYAAKCLHAASSTLRTADDMYKDTSIRSAYWVNVLFNSGPNSSLPCILYSMRQSFCYFVLFRIPIIRRMMR